MRSTESWSDPRRYRVFLRTVALFDQRNYLTGFGILVHPVPTMDGTRVLYAEVEPAYTGWRPWRGRTSLWWYEVHAVHAADERGVDGSTYAYVEGGSGGAFTFRGCVRKAQQAINHFAEEHDDA